MAKCPSSETNALPNCVMEPDQWAEYSDDDDDCLRLESCSKVSTTGCDSRSVAGWDSRRLDSIDEKAWSGELTASTAWTGRDSRSPCISPCRSLNSSLNIGTGSDSSDLGGARSTRPPECFEARATWPRQSRTRSHASYFGAALPALRRTRTSLDIGHTSCTFNDFEILRALGTGFISSVCEVKLRNDSDAIPFALKIMRKSSVIQKSQTDHVLQEKQLLGKVNHPFVIKLLTTFQDDAHLFLLLEYVEGGELFAVIRDRRRLPDAAAKLLAAEITLALGHIHSMDIAYRDLKPENVLVDSRGHTKIADFGFAKVVPTLTWTKCGTAEYMAPEIVSKQGHDKAVDWWAMGILIFEMLVGQPPFMGSNSAEIHAKVTTSEPKYRPHLTSGSQSIIGGLLNKNRLCRLGSKRGVEDVQSHEWYSALNWDMVLQKKYPPPIEPPGESEADACELDFQGVTSSLSAAEQRLFIDF